MLIRNGYALSTFLSPLAKPTTPFHVVTIASQESHISTVVSTSNLGTFGAALAAAVVISGAIFGVRLVERK